MRFATRNKFAQTVIAGCAVLLMVLVIFGFTGRYFAPGDSIALMRPQVGVLLVLFAVILLAVHARGFALASLVFAMIAVGSVAAGFIPASDDCDDTCVTLYQKNLMSKAWPRYPLADDILQSNAEIVTLQEVSSHNQEYMSNLFDHYPRSAICEFRPEQNVAILTTLPVVEGTEFCLHGLGLVGLQVVGPDKQPVWVVSVHLNWPYPYEQFEQSKRIARHIEQLEGPVLIAGDFNMVHWGSSVRRIGSAADNQVFGPALNTHNRGSWMLPMPIDNLLVPKGTTGTAELRPFMGSDHLGIKARISLP
ncbi:endonuclease/exonuclease/phosphatase family protein [Ruegeria lacuscaerulensis]|uniref:endonuclease/exonuclease/phosphatase family protein n=1 Tax=Ruegeria lacuscaerulensis TaxID=55218 RepID=UPI00148036A6|nr:endonuclease/exonuclease/phosphatase family protein [Ruegeria lacuscaerulensis]